MEVEFHYLGVIDCSMNGFGRRGLLKRRRSSQQTTQPIVISASPHRSNQGYIEYIKNPITQTH